MNKYTSSTEKTLGKSIEEMRKEIMEELKNNGEEVLAKLDYVLEVLRKQKEEDKKEDNNQDKINKAFETKQIGRPVGSWEDKRKQYFEWIKSGKITQPKEETLAYYKINKDPTNNSYVLLS